MVSNVAKRVLDGETTSKVVESAQVIAQYRRVETDVWSQELAIPCHGLISTFHRHQGRHCGFRFLHQESQVFREDVHGFPLVA